MERNGIRKEKVADSKISGDVWTGLACVAWRFWLGALSNKDGRGQRNREEIGAGATWISRGFAARSRA